MTLKNLGVEEFTEYASNHSQSTYYQTVNYAMLKAENNFDYDLIGLVDEYDHIIAASLILLKPIGIGCYYGYAPRGFLMNYNNEYLINTFTEELKKYYYEKNCVFIKLNPNIIVGELNKKTLEIEHNDNNFIKERLNSDFHKLKDNLFFESQLPRYNAIIDLKETSTSLFSKNTRNKIKKGIRKGLKLELVTKESIKDFYEFVKNKTPNDEFYYQDYYTVFEKNDSVDLFLVSIDYNAFLDNSRYSYDEELKLNEYLNNKIVTSKKDKVINAKMNSDRTLLTYKNDIMEATKGVQENNKVYLAGALVIKNKDTVTIAFSGYNPKYKRFAPNYFLHYSLIKYYKNEYNYLDLGGMVGDFKEENEYTGLNRFKLGFDPHVYEYLGEYDLIIEPKTYKSFLQSNILVKEFNKKTKNTQK